MNRREFLKESLSLGGLVATSALPSFGRGILAGHIHLTAQDRFSPTAMEYVIGGNFLHAAEEVIIV